MNVEPARLTPMLAPEDSSAPSAALLPSSERCRFFDQSRKRPAVRVRQDDGAGISHDEGAGAPILVEAVAPRSAVVAAIDIISRGEPEASSRRGRSQHEVKQFCARFA